MTFHEAATLIGEPAQAAGRRNHVEDEGWQGHAEPPTVEEPVPGLAAMPTAATIAPPPVEPPPPVERPSERSRKRFVDVSTVQQRLNDESALLRRVERDPNDPVAAEHLEALYLRRGDHEGLVALLLDRAAASDDDDQRAGLLVRASRIYRTELNDLDSARVILVTALGAAPGDARVHEELDAVVCASGDFAAARAAYADAALASAGDRELAGELWLRVASLHIMERGGAAAICAAFARVEAASPERVAAIVGLCERLAGELVVLDAIIALHRRLGDRAAESRVLSLSIDHATEPVDRARRHHAIAELAMRRKDDLEAEWHLAEALRLAPARTQTRVALADLYRRRGEPRRAARVLEEARHASPNAIDRANLACQAADIYANELGERTRALDLYHVVLASDPDRADAAAPLAERYWQRGMFAELEPLIEQLVRRASSSTSATSDQVAELTYRAGKTALELGKHERALGYLRTALARAPRRPDVLRATAAAASALGRTDEAYQALTTALDLEERAGGPGGDSPDRIDTLAELAALADLRGDPHRAMQLYRDALGRAPAHPRALSGACELLCDRGDAHGAADLLRAAVDASVGIDRARVLRDLAALHANDLEDPERAMRLYQEVLALSPTDRATLTALVELYTAAELWREAVEALTSLAELEQVGFRRGRYFQIAAQVARGRLGDDATAALYNQALDGFFADGEPPEDHLATCLRAFDDLDSYLRARGAYRPLERSYRMMIRRLGAGAPELGELWARLGDLYRDNLGEPAAAIQAHEVAASLDGDRATRHRILIDLYEGFAPDEIDKLIERRQRLVRHEPLVAEHYRALSNLYRQTDRRDHAYLALRAVASLGAATAGERAELAQLDTERPAWARRALGPEHHARARHHEEDLRITSVLAIVAEAIAAELAAPPKRLRLVDDPSPGWQPLRELHRGVSVLVGAPPPPLFVCPELDTELVFANVIINGRATLALAAGGRMARADKPQALHNLARTLAHVRPAYFLRLLLCEPGALDAALDAALVVGGFRGRTTGNGAAHHFAQAIDRRLAPASRAHLSSIVGAIDDTRQSMNVQRWGESVDATCRRVALLIGGDLATAIAALGREMPHAARRPLQERLADLLVYSISHEHAALRADLGLALP